MSATKQPIRVTFNMLAGVMLGDMTDNNLGHILGPQWAPACAPKSVVKTARPPLRASSAPKSRLSVGKLCRA